MRLRVLAIFAAVCVGAAPSLAQREAISSTLSPEAAATAFNDMVITVCIPAVAQGGIPRGVRGKLQQTNDAATRRQFGAAADETVWDVMAAKGVVTVHETSKRCVVSVYGPPAPKTVSDLTRLLVNAKFERLAAAPPLMGAGETLTRTDNGERLMVMLKGSDPGAPGRRSRFSVITATVFSPS